MRDLRVRLEKHNRCLEDNILLKPGRLRPEEFEIIKTHTTIGADTVGAVRRQYPQNSFPNPSVLP